MGTVPIDVVAHSPTAAEFFWWIREAMLCGPVDVARLALRRLETFGDPASEVASARLSLAR